MNTIIVFICLLLIILLFIFFSRDSKRLAGFVFRAVAGLVVIVVTNVLLLPLGITIGVGPVPMVIIGMLGVPGLVSLYFAQLIL